MLIVTSKMLKELIDILWSAKISGNEYEIEQAYRNLAEIGIDRERADVALSLFNPLVSND